MVKRFFDICSSFVGLIILFPIFLLVAIWIKFDSPGPVFFRQRRVGLLGEDFLIHKFRTMVVDSESSGRLTIGKDNRITRSGHFLRKSKIDELPQLIDVLLGTMSLVGPRPEVREFIDCYPENIKSVVLSVRPGITDKASIEMVDENEILSKYKDPKQAYIDFILPIKQKYYVEYVESHTLLLDITLILKTFMKIIGRR
ncbi:sugar transferase [Shewanella oncorhynchi]|uniref:sugar transferase n=1 Tax=Shewanella oncorhynchi TaxID=2726434 RepID=UPI003D7B33DE